ncbi:MAG: DUF4384 domain-containing protein [Planctomycetes bacterium]|nr:DUF4384 domain-containing protein [Planctomycetota bacterium]
MQRLRLPSLLVLLLLVALGCAGQVGGAMLDSAFSVIKKTFLGAATANYGDGYRDEFDKVLSALTDVAKGKVSKLGEDPAPAASSGAASSAASGSAASGSNASSDSGAASAPVASTPPVAPAPAAPAPLELEFVLLKEEVVDGRSVPAPVADGDVLYDRFGTHGAGDNLKLRLRAGSACWVYAISIDSTGWARPLFPSTYTAQANPLPANTTVEVPPGRNWATLDSYRGVEHVYVLASRTQRVDLEQALAGLAANVRDVDPARVLEQRTKVELVASAAPISRGWDVARPSQFADVQSSQGATFSVDTQIFAAKAADELVITRWFRHQ